MQQHVLDFVKFALPLAKQVEAEYGIPYYLCIAQAAVETGWGRSARNNNYFGHTGRGESLRTREEAATAEDLAAIFSGQIDQTTIKQLSNGRWEAYGIRQFRTFEKPIQSFLAYGNNLYTNSAYSYAWQLKKTDEIAFIRAICKKYATAADYANTVISVINTVKTAEKML